MEKWKNGKMEKWSLPYSTVMDNTSAISLFTIINNYLMYIDGCINNYV